MKDDYHKVLKEWTSFFLSNQVPFDGQDYEKQKESRTRDLLLFRLQHKFRKFILLVMYYLTRLDVIWTGFWVIPIFTSANVWKAIHDTQIIPLSLSLLNLESMKEEGKKISLSRGRKALFRWNTNSAIICEKIKNSWDRL